MPKNNIPIDTTGLPQLDAALTGILAGDNIVWNVDDIGQYRKLAVPYALAAKRDGRNLVYFRFARHERLVPEGFCEECRLDPEAGFEVFLHQIHAVIGDHGLGAYYLFDCLSDLATNWCSDAMLGNFFLLTCPYLYRLETVAYFGLLRGRHSRLAVDPVRGTTQLFFEVFGHGDRLFLLPIKTEFRHSPTIHLMLEWDGADRFSIVRSSAVLTQVMGRVLPRAARIETYGDDVVRRAEEIVRDGKASGSEAEALKRRLLGMMVTRDESILPLVDTYFTLEDVLDIRWRLAGTGLIGGKAVGMLLARKIAERECPGLGAKLEEHDSFYIGSDIFYSFLVRNGLWEIREKQHSPDTFLDHVEEAQERILNGKFSHFEVRLFEKMLDYFGQYPVIVRSSSLLEDAYGNSFAGKYDSVFCANQGPLEERLRAFLDAIRSVYASSMSSEALSYRERHGLLKRDEQMALLVMRVAGELQGSAFYPHLAGVGFSYNPFAWGPEIDPRAGVLRLVYGLGTRAVDRVDDDYTRVVALNAPLRRPEGSLDEIVRHSQRRMDFMDLASGRLASGEFSELSVRAEGVPLDLFTTETEGGGRILTFDGLLTDTDFVKEFRLLLKTLERIYGKPVDIEFVVNFMPGGKGYMINLLQCRPLQVQGTHRPEVPPVECPAEGVLLESRGAVVGHSRVERLDWLVLVVPEVYGAMPERDRHRVARAVGEVNRAIGARGATALAAAPGRWGTHMASLGVPVRFSEIGHMTAICELMMMHEFLTPDVSLGTHFFGELVEMNILYFALFPGRAGNRLNLGATMQAPNRLAELAPEAADQAQVLRAVRADDLTPDGVWLIADGVEQDVVVTLCPPMLRESVGV
ncbi:MAG TPA: phosphoenolpyruvate synthase [Verrucomicrobia bacterium]|nr:phosphoenolpyruvate synthase [Verrucomicrobiota bacterium]